MHANTRYINSTRGTDWREREREEGEREGERERERIDSFLTISWLVDAISKLSLKRQGCLQNLGGINCFLMSSNIGQHRIK